MRFLAFALLAALVVPGAAQALGPGPPPPVSTVLDDAGQALAAACAPLDGACGQAFGAVYGILDPFLPPLPP